MYSTVSFLVLHIKEYTYLLIYLLMFVASLEHSNICAVLGL